MQGILLSCKAQNFSDLALLAMQNYRSAFQNRLLVWTTYEIDPYLWFTRTFANQDETDAKSRWMFARRDA
jgi:hypothetical protein